MARPPIVVGSHKYSGTDAHRTLLSVGPLWRHHMHDVKRNPSRVATVGAELAQSLESLIGLRTDKNPDHELGAVSRVYCLVTQPGEIAVGDAVICN